MTKLYRIRPLAQGPGLLSIDNEGKERYARLRWRGATVTERVPLQYFNMGPAAREMETRRVVAELIRKMRVVCGSIPKDIEEANG